MKKLFTLLLSLSLLLSACGGPLGSNAPEDMPEELKQSFIDNIEVSLSQIDEGTTGITVYSDLGYAYQMLGEYDEAIHYYELILELDISNYQALNNMVDIYEDLEDTEQAREYAKLLYSYNADNASVLKKVIIVFLADDQPELALEALENFARLHSGDDAYTQLISDQYEKIADTN